MRIQHNFLIYLFRFSFHSVLCDSSSQSIFPLSNRTRTSAHHPRRIKMNSFCYWLESHYAKRQSHLNQYSNVRARYFSNPTFQTDVTVQVLFGIFQYTSLLWAYGCALPICIVRSSLPHLCCYLRCSIRNINICSFQSQQCEQLIFLSLRLRCFSYAHSIWVYELRMIMGRFLPGL